MKFFLQGLSDDELLALVKSNDLGEWIDLIKTEPKKYKKYDARLGRLDRRNLLLRQNLPQVVVELYQQNEPEAKARVESFAEQSADQMMALISTVLDREVSLEDLKNYTVEEYIHLLETINKNGEKEHDLTLFVARLKVCGISFSEEQISELNEKYQDTIVGLEEETDEAALGEMETSEKTTIHAVSNKPKAGKTKKLTAQEKAQKAKKNLEAKKATLIHDEDPSGIIGDAPADNTESPQKPELEAPSKPQSSNNNEEKESNKMPVYIGKVNIISNYYNFTPLYILENGYYSQLMESDIEKLLPDSFKHNINLFYSVWDFGQSAFMKETFHNNSLFAFEFTLDDLELNMNSDNEINQTGYKVPAIERYKSGYIKVLSKLGLYRLLSKDDFNEDIESRRAVTLSSDNLVLGEEILVDMGDGFYAGPFDVKISTNAQAYISTQTLGAKGVIWGYSSANCSRVTINAGDWTSYGKWEYYRIDSGAEKQYLDVITDRELLNSLKDTLGKAELDYSDLNVDEVIAKHNESLITGANLPDEIKNARLERIRKILTEEDDLESIYTDLSDMICELLLKNEHHQLTGELLSSAFDNNPDLLDRFQGLRIIKTHVESARQELGELRAQKSEIDEDLSKPATKSQENMEDELSQELQDKKKELSALYEKLNIAQEADDIQDRIGNLKEEVKYLDSHKAHLSSDTKNLEKSFVDLITGYTEKMADVTFDGFIASKMLQTAAQWEKTEKDSELGEFILRVNNRESADYSVDELVKYVVDTVQIARPGYSKNDILNIVICAMQGFLTVFSGTPGCGKTSICNIISQVLGLSNLQDLGLNPETGKEYSRYILVSIERGWTSKRDFIGYYNPLTKAFEESNREVYDGLKLLSMESHKGIKKFPFVILLDEANLSPMEYYWADFMNICDDQKLNHTINLGNDNVFEIPETLHFLATINNDHTTETLSPRLIDRAWIITLPRSNKLIYGKEIPFDKVKPVSWETLKSAFVSLNESVDGFDGEIRNIYDGLLELLKGQSMYISPRVHISILNYWRVASAIMENDEFDNDPSVIALDYAVSQKILPKIMGSGDKYEEWLNDLKGYCSKNYLIHSAELVDSILSRGNNNMKYYQFFD